MSLLTAGSPIAEAVFSTLQDATLQTAVGGRLSSDPPQNESFPYVWIEIFNQDNARGFGTRGMEDVDLRVHVFSTFQGRAEANAIGLLIKNLLEDQALTITGYDHCGRVFWDRTVAIPDAEINGVKCHELVLMCRVIAEES